MKLEKKYSDGHLALSLEGELDQHTAQGLFREMESVMDRYLPRSCAVDLSRLSFMDSSGIAVVLRLRKKAGENGIKIWLEDPSPQPMRVLAASGIGRLVKIENRKGSVNR
ncbi:MAG: STAS domain-containing protein [Oscillospiraceae bacterium]|nr:STAS domain-containing protein [Oscillospiraceae bacterium]